MHATPNISDKRQLDVAAQTTFRLRYYSSLDGLRGVSILLVMFVHSLSMFSGGWVGVDMFFVLSGFLITVILLQEWTSRGSINLMSFYYRRALRLLPALFLVVGAVWVLTVLFLPAQELRLAYKSILGALFYYSNFRIPHYTSKGDMLIHTWSLSLEEQFYLVWPIALSILLRLRWNRGWILGVVGAGIVTANCSKIYILNRGLNVFNIFFLPHTRADTLLIGCFAGLLVYWGIVPTKRSALLVRNILCAFSCLALAWIAVFSGMPKERFYCVELNLAAVSVGVIIVSLMNSPPAWLSVGLTFPPLVWLGKVSYGLYLIHYPVNRFICLFSEGYFPSDSFPHLSHAQQVALEYTISLSLATLSFYIIERPCLKFKGSGRKPVAVVTIPSQKRLAA
jgi:peptidoglycan/LPS O-acetylase OafA/YrhL